MLLVEDDETTRQFLHMALGDAFVLGVATTAAEALDIARQGELVYDILLLDISLRPGPGGVAILKALREMEAYRHTPAIAMTAYDRDAAPEDFMSAGFDEYLRKPFYERDLLNLINQLLGPNAE